MRHRQPVPGSQPLPARSGRPGAGDGLPDDRRCDPKGPGIRRPPQPTTMGCPQPPGPVGFQKSASSRDLRRPAFPATNVSAATGACSCPTRPRASSGRRCCKAATRCSGSACWRASWSSRCCCGTGWPSTRSARPRWPPPSGSSWVRWGQSGRPGRDRAACPLRRRTPRLRAGLRRAGLGFRAPVGPAGRGAHRRRPHRYRDGPAAPGLSTKSSTVAHRHSSQPVVETAVGRDDTARRGREPG